MTPLMKAARAGQVSKVGRLIERGAKVDQQSRFGWTALMFAAWQGHEEVVTVLIDSGADPNV